MLTVRLTYKQNKTVAIYTLHRQRTLTCVRFTIYWRMYLSFQASRLHSHCWSF